jgi:chaperonin GroES
MKPLNDRVIIKPDPTEEKTESGFVIPETAKEKPQRGTVVAVGNGRFSEQGILIPMHVCEGDVVMYGKFVGSEIEFDGESCTIMSENDILTIE